MARKYCKNCNCKDLDDYIRLVCTGKVKTSKEVKQQYAIVREEFRSNKIEVDTIQYDKYLKIGYLFFDEIFNWQKAAMALCLCTYKRGTRKARWNKMLIEVGRGNGKDGMIAWFSCCLTSKYHGILNYDVDIIANNMTQSLRPIEDIEQMIERKNKSSFYKRVGESIISYKTNSNINARSSEAEQHDGLRSGAVIFNEIHLFKDYKKLNVMITGLGKIDDPKTFYFTTNGDYRGGVLDEMLDSAKDILDGTYQDRGKLFLIYKLDDKKQVHKKDNWVRANPSLPFRETLLQQMEDEYDIWSKNPNQLPAFLQKRMNLPEMPTDQEVVPWDVIKKTTQEYDYTKLEGSDCIVGIDMAKTTDWIGVNFLFYDDELDKFVCVNHAFICANNRDLQGIKAPYTDWVNEGYCSLIDALEVDPDIVVNYINDMAEKKCWNVKCIVIDEYKKGVMKQALKKFGYEKELGNLKIVRPSNIAPIVPVIESAFLNERLIFNNPVLRWATNNTKLVPWKPTKSTGDADLGNQLYAKINPRFRKTDPFMAFVHSMIENEELVFNVSYQDYEFRGF